MREREYLLDDEALEHELAVGALQEAALHAVRGCQPEDQHRPGLPNPVSPVHGLLTHTQPHDLLSIVLVANPITSTTQLLWLRNGSSLQEQRQPPEQ